MRTRLFPLALAALLALAGTTPALADPGPSGTSGPGHNGSHGPGSDEPGSDEPGSHGPGSGAGESGSDGGHADADGHAQDPPPAGRSSRESVQVAPARASSTRPSAPEPAPPVGSVAGRRSAAPRLSTAPGLSTASGLSPSPGLAAVAEVAGAALLLAAMVAAGFRARARLGRLG